MWKLSGLWLPIRSGPRGQQLFSQRAYVLIMAHCRAGSDRHLVHRPRAADLYGGIPAALLLIGLAIECFVYPQGYR